jgi:hypothetical protein
LANLTQNSVEPLDDRQVLTVFDEVKLETIACATGES